MGPTIEIRPAAPSDAAEIAEAHVRAWQAAYRGLMPQDFLDGLDVERREAGWRRLLDGPTGFGVLVPVLDGRVVGFASTGPSRDDAEGLAELYAINLHPDAWGHGAGSALLRAAEGEIARRGHHEAVLWVVPGNTRARRFYERHGWTSDGVERPIDVADGVSVPELRYRRALPGA